MNTLLQRLISFFARLLGGATLAAAEPSQPVSTTPAQKPPRKKQAARKPAVGAKTMGALLDSLDATFESLRLADHAASWTSKKLRDGLRALGPLVPFEETPVCVSSIDNPETAVFPSLLFVAVPVRLDSDRWHYPKFYYANKVEKFASTVRETEVGERYECGVCFATWGTKRLLWINFGITINRKTGNIGIVRMRASRFHPLPGRGDGYRRPEWGTADIGFGNQSEAEMKEITAMTFNAWQTREQSWRVSAKKDGRRVTFCIPDNAAPAFFGSRDRTALTPTGRMKPIIHFVSSHARIVSGKGTTTVREHIRGLREFDWNGSRCAVVAPKWHKWDSDTFQAAGTCEDDITRDGWAVDVDSMGQLLADAEDTQRLPKPRMTHVHAPEHRPGA